MRFIPWDQEVVDYTLRDFKDFNGHQVKHCGVNIGFIAENLVKSYYKQPLSANNHCSDGGWDMLWDGHKVDIKSDNCNLKYFSNSHSLFVISCKYGFRADVYLFTKIDPENHRIALIGYLEPEEIMLLGTRYSKGDYIPQFKRATDEDCYLIKQSDLHSIS